MKSNDRFETIQMQGYSKEEITPVEIICHTSFVVLNDIFSTQKNYQCYKDTETVKFDITKEQIQNGKVKCKI